MPKISQYNLATIMTDNDLLLMQKAADGTVHAVKRATAINGAVGPKGDPGPSGPRPPNAPLVGGSNGAFISVSDLAPINATAPGTDTIPRTIGAVLTDELSIHSYVSSPVSGTDYSAVITQALADARVVGKTLVFDWGDWACQNVVLQQGDHVRINAHARILQIGYANACFISPTVTYNPQTLVDQLPVIVEGFGRIKGNFDTDQSNPSGRAAPVNLSHMASVVFRDITVEWSQASSLAAIYCCDVLFQNCKIRWSARDGIAFHGSTRVQVLGCSIVHCDDNGIAGHTTNLAYWSSVSEVVIVGNTLTDTCGIACQGFKRGRIAYNTIARNRQVGILINPTGNTTNPDNPQQGHSPAHTFSVENNTITDLLNRAPLDGLINLQTNIAVASYPSQAGILGAIPGFNVPSAGVVIPPDAWNDIMVPNDGGGGIPVSAGSHIAVRNNTVRRTMQTGQSLAVGGTITTGQVVTLTATGGVLASPVTVTYTVQAGDDANHVVSGLAAAVNAASALVLVGVTGALSPATPVLVLTCPPALGIAWSASATGSGLTLAFPALAELGGTVTAGDVVSLTATSGSLSGSPITVSHTVANGETNASITTSLIAALAANSTLAAGGVSGWASPSSAVINIISPARLNISWAGAVSGAATETVTIETAGIPYSAYGFGQMFTRFGWIDPIITATALSHPTAGRGVSVSFVNSIVQHLVVEGNQIEGYCIGISAAAGVQIWDGVIRNNRIKRFSSYGISLANSTANRVLIEGNEVDGDPFLEAPGRAVGGTWQSGAIVPAALSVTSVTGLVYSRNHHRNLALIAPGGLPANVGMPEVNFLYCQPNAVGYDAANRGIGNIYRPDQGFLSIVEDCDPRSTTFGQRLFDPPRYALAQPTTGTWVIGDFVRNVTSSSATAGSFLLGWYRRTTGSSNSASWGADWTPLLASAPGGYGKQSVSGGSYSMPLTMDELVITGAGTFASYAVTLPPVTSTPDGKVISISTATGLTITALSVLPPSGATTSPGTVSIAMTPSKTIRLKLMAGVYWLVSS